MARGSEVRVTLIGDADKLTRTFDQVGQSAEKMSKDVGRSTKNFSSVATDSFDTVDTRAMGFRDAMTGVEDSMKGLSDIAKGDLFSGFLTLGMGVGDLASSMVNLVIPALTAMKSTLLTGLAPALTAISAHPLIAAFLVGGAIVAALVVLEKKFGVVSGAVRFMGDAIGAVWDRIKGLGAGAWDWMLTGLKAVGNLVLASLETIGNAAINALLGPIALANKIPGIKSIVPDVPRIRLPRLHSGGEVGGVPGSEQLAILQAGETVLPRGANAGGGGLTVIVQGSVIMERELDRVLTEALRRAPLYGYTG